MITRLLLLISLLLHASVHAGAPRVVVTLKPIHSLVASIMVGIGEPELLLPDGASPHTYQLKPSTLKAINQAELIIWVGPELENFMQKAIHSKQKQAFALMQIPQLQRLPQRHTRHWHHANHDAHHEHAHSAMDPHIWLSVHNAKIIVDAVTQRLILDDPINKKAYAENRLRTLNQLHSLFKTMTENLQPIRDKPFLVYHDGYQYLEQEFNLNGKGSIILNPHVPLSGKALHELKQQINDEQIHCVFTETEFNQTQLEKNLQMLQVNFAELDPLAVKQAPGPSCYIKMMTQTSKIMQDCLAKKT
jgi:zinc transport system substrate-binding protein